MGKSLEANLSDNVLFLFQGIQKGTVERGGAQEWWRMGIGALEQMVSRQR